MLMCYLESREQTIENLTPPLPYTQLHIKWWVIYLIPRDKFGGPSGADGRGWRAFGISLRPAGWPGSDPPAFDPISRWMRRWTSNWQSRTGPRLATWRTYSLAHTYATRTLTYCTGLWLIPHNCSYQSVSHQSQGERWSSEVQTLQG